MVAVAATLTFPLLGGAGVDDAEHPINNTIITMLNAITNNFFIFVFQLSLGRAGASAPGQLYFELDTVSLLFNTLVIFANCAESYSLPFTPPVQQKRGKADRLLLLPSNAQIHELRHYRVLAQERKADEHKQRKQRPLV